MRFGVLGTGVVGKIIAGKLVDVGHEVMIGSRDPAATRVRRGLLERAEFHGRVLALPVAEHPAGHVLVRARTGRS